MYSECCKIFIFLTKKGVKTRNKLSQKAKSNTRPVPEKTNEHDKHKQYGQKLT